ncbi:MAG: hypothetical protein ABW184_01270 [Sphingobium sp.]
MAMKAKDLDIRVRNGAIGWRHIESEYLDVVEDILDTLVPDGPYAYTVSPGTVAAADGYAIPAGTIPHQTFVSTKQGLRESYESLHRFSAVRGMEAIAEVRGDWYTFFYGLGEGLVKPTGQIVYSPTILLFPTMGKDGITGELFWSRTGVGACYDGGREGPLAVQTAILAKHEGLLEALRNADAAAVASFYDPGAQIGIRDYLDDAPTLVDLHSADEFKHYLERFFARFRIVDIGVVQRLVQDWFVFCELLWVVEDRQNPGRTLSFYTADHGEMRSDGLLATRIGFGTDAVTL